MDEKSNEDLAKEILEICMYRQPSDVLFVLTKVVGMIIAQDAKSRHSADKLIEHINQALQKDVFRNWETMQQVGALKRMLCEEPAGHG